MSNEDKLQGIIDGLIDNIHEYQDIEIALRAQLETANKRLEIYDDMSQQLSNWARAYPLDIFPEPDFKRVRELLEAGGITLDSVSASNMRHVITGVGEIVNYALSKIERLSANAETRVNSETVNNGDGNDKIEPKCKYGCVTYE